MQEQLNATANVVFNVQISYIIFYCTYAVVNILVVHTYIALCFMLAYLGKGSLAAVSPRYCLLTHIPYLWVVGAKGNELTIYFYTVP